MPSTMNTISRTLTLEECLALLGTTPVGRVALVVDGRPHIVPVNYAVADDVVVFRAAPGTILNESVMRDMAFETDWIDGTTRSGWSVCVHGFCRDITDALDDKSQRLRRLDLDCWAPTGRELWYEVVADEITGRRLYPPTPANPPTAARR